MTRLALLLALCSGLQDTPRAAITPGEATPKAWGLIGSAEVPDGIGLTISARRLARNWQDARGRFTERTSENRLRTFAEVRSRAFQAALRPDSVGRYAVTVHVGEQQLLQGRMALGELDKFFQRSKGLVPRLSESIRKALAFVEELERIVMAKDPPGPRAREEFLRRVAEEERFVDQAVIETDLTATCDLLVAIYYHIRNAQVWDRARRPRSPAAENDPDSVQGIFLEKGLTFKGLRDRIASARSALAAEVKLSVTVLLEDVFARAGSQEMRLAAARRAASEAVKLLERAPDAEKDFTRLVDAAASSTTKMDDLLKGLREMKARYLEGE